MAQFILPARATDANGNPLPGALLYFYRAGTTTEVSTFTASTRTVAHSHPVVADAAGLFPSIYLNPDVAYRALLRTAAGVQVSDSDPYETPDSDVVSGASFGALGDGVTDDRAALQAAMNTGKPVALVAGATYIIASGLEHVTGSGFVCSDGIATIKARTGATGFNIKTTAVPRDGLDRNMLRCNGTDNLIIRNVLFTTDNITPVVLHGVRMTGGMGTAGYDIQNISFSRFFNGSCMALGSTGSGRKRTIHISSAADCGTSEGNTYWAAGLQMTVLEIDNDITPGTPSVAGVVKIDLMRDILHSGAALTNFGQETDGVNIVCQGLSSTSGWDIEVGIADRIGEVIDVQGFRNTVRVGVINNSYGDAIKLTHGAQYNDITIGTITASGRSVINLAGSVSPVTAGDTKGNVVRIGSVVNPGTFGLGLTGAPGDTVVALISNTTSTWKPSQNVVHIDNVFGDGINLDHVVKDGGADNNLENTVFVGKASGWFVSSVSAPPDNVRVIYGGRCHARMTMSVAQAIATATATKVAFDTVAHDTEGVTTPASNRFTLRWPGAYAVRTQVRGDAWAVGANDSCTIEIRLNGVTQIQTRAKINFTAKDETFAVADTIHIAENNLTTSPYVDVFVTQDTGASKTVSNSIIMSAFSIERVA